MNENNIEKRYSLSKTNLQLIHEYTEMGECGAKISYQLSGVGSSSEAMKLGIYYEFLALGSLPRDGKIPLPKRNKTGGSDGLTKKAAAYELAVSNAKKFKHFLEEIGIEIDVDPITGKKRVGEVIEFPGHNSVKRRIKMVIDAVAVATKDINLFAYEYPYGATRPENKPLIKAGQKFILDTKYSAMAGHKHRFDKKGWHPDRFEEKPNLLLQAVQYVWQWRKMYNEKILFVFAVASSANDTEFMFLAVDVSDETLHKFENETLVRGDLWLSVFESMDGRVEARPSYERCSTCEFREFIVDGDKFNCPHAAHTPFIYQFHI